MNKKAYGLSSELGDLALIVGVDFYISKAPTLVKSVGYVPLSAEAYHLDKVQFFNGEVGTAFDGKAQLNLSLAEVLRKKATF